MGHHVTVLIQSKGQKLVGGKIKCIDTSALIKWNEKQYINYENTKNDYQQYRYLWDLVSIRATS